MAPNPLDTAALDQLIEDINAAPDEVDGIDLRQHKQGAAFQLGMARNQVLMLRKLATPLAE